jgi:hypothetical protein
VVAPEDGRRTRLGLPRAVLPIYPARGNPHRPQPLLLPEFFFGGAEKESGRLDRAYASVIRRSYATCA